ncbi:OstA family protein [Deinococcus irradiatisoli]|uniref:OstA family protein n=1 Tax=Deinococcus irradiatisoli TaxID=2202254 RepID=A0A2Z3JVB0_9DEIO|nr:OstA family protein [Deinococcus irradiatisoli]
MSPADPAPTLPDPSGGAADDTDSDTDTPDSDEAIPSSDDAAADEEGANVTLTRKAKDGKERVIKIVRTGLTDDTGIFASCTPQDSDPAGSPTLSVFSETGPGGIQVTVDKNLIRAPLAIVTQQESGDGHIEMSAGTARFLDEPPEGQTDRLSRCAVEAKPQPAPDTVFVKQGRTDLKGKTLTYDESDGVARIDGPITFERSAEAGKPDSDKLSGTSERIEVNVDNETTTLVGQVVLKNGARTSTAARVDYDDAANVAVLRGEAGKPAESVDGKDVIRAPVLRYNLDLNTVIALRSEDTPITGEFDDGDPAPAAGSSPVPAAPPTP